MVQKGKNEFLELKNMFLACAAALWGILSGHLYAKTNPDHNWVTVMANGQLPQGILAHFEYQPRFLTSNFKTQAIMHRNAFGIQVTEKSSVWIGHAYLETRLPNKFSEYRTFLQSSHNLDVFKIAFAHRFRLEQRKFSRYAHISHRTRYKIRFMRILFEAIELNYVVQNEIFYNINTIANNSRGGFEQNRLYFGLNKNLGESHSVEIGATIVTRFIKNETNDQMNLYMTKYNYSF
jgi:hypothetical protein